MARTVFLSNFKEKIFRSKRYGAWIRTLPCMFCGDTDRGNASGLPTEADHIGPRGLSQKGDDRLRIPACTRCHPYRQRYDFKGLAKEIGKLYSMVDIWKAAIIYLCRYLDEGRKF